MQEIKGIINTHKAVNALFSEKKDKFHKRSFLMDIWDVVGQSIKYPNFEIDDLSKQYIDYFCSQREEFYPQLLENSCKGLLVMGDVGTGKTANFRIFKHLYNKINVKNEVEDISKGEKTVKYLPPLSTVNGDLFHMIHVKQIEHNLRIEGEESIERLAKVKKLVIDDFGLDDEIKDWGSARNPTIDIVNIRYEKMFTHGLITHFTTNFNSADIKKKYGDRIADRITEMTIKLGIKGKSKRK